MPLQNLFKTNTRENAPLDASGGTAEGPIVSEFLTIQSFTNFAAMTGAITATWLGLQKLWPDASTFWVPYGMAMAWGIISLLISYNDLTRNTTGLAKIGAVAAALFIAFVNSIVLGSAVVGTHTAVS